MLDDSPSVRKLSCELLGTLTEETAQKLQVFRFLTIQFTQLAACISLLLGALVETEDPMVTSSARSFYYSANTKDDSLFLTDLVHVIPPLVAQKNLMIRIRASWALANLCDAMMGVECSENNVGLLFDSAMHACRDKGAGDKCKGNGVRALGSLWKMGRRDDGIVDVLIKCSSSGAMKTVGIRYMRWLW
jgi:hypothetical protein